MGTPLFALSILKKLVESDHRVVAVVTAEDKPAGRGQKIQISPVKSYALEQHIPVLQPKNLKNPEFLATLKSYDADLQIVVAFRMLPKAVWQMPRLGTFNLHASLLPEYRGAAPINWVIINRERQSGVTTFLIDDKIDTGAILLQQKIDLSERETCGTLHDKLMEIGGDLVLKTVAGLVSKELIPIAQPAFSSKEAPKIYKETCRINWTDTGENIDAFIRGMSPYPCAWTLLCEGDNEYFIKIYSGFLSPKTHQSDIGKIYITNRELGVYVNDGIYFIEELQLSGKKRMKVRDFLNGVTFPNTAFFQ